MDDFSRMMDMEGVRRLGEKPLHVPRRPQSRTQAPESTAPMEPIASPGKDLAAWATGQLARKGLETALSRLAGEAAAGRRGWATGIRQDGNSVVLSSTSTTASLLSAADRQDLRLVVLGGEGWTFVLHPMMGVATLDRDPKDAAP